MIEIYSKDNCPLCDKAKLLCQMKGLEYQEKDIYEHIDEITERSGQRPRMAPQIFVDDSYIGGFNEFDAHLKAQA